MNGPSVDVELRYTAKVDVEVRGVVQTELMQLCAEATKRFRAEVEEVVERHTKVPIRWYNEAATVVDTSSAYVKQPLSE